MSKLVWYGHILDKRVRLATRGALDKAGAIVTRSIKESFPGADGVGSHSAKGEIPHIQTGTLKRSIGWELVSDIEAHVGHKLGTQTFGSGAPATYGFFLELGTAKMAPRPHLRPGLTRERRRINKLFENII